MIEVKSSVCLPDVVDWSVLEKFQADIRQNINLGKCPPEVKQFIEALADKLGDFAQIRKDVTYLYGSDLLLCGMKYIKGEKVDPYTMYPTPLPYMVAVDNRASMYRSYLKNGKQGLINFVKAKVNGTELEPTLMILNVHVFKQERPEFKILMDEIKASKKIDSQIDV